MFETDKNYNIVVESVRATRVNVIVSHRKIIRESCVENNNNSELRRYNGTRRKRLYTYIAC